MRRRPRPTAIRLAWLLLLGITVSCMAAVWLTLSYPTTPPGGSMSGWPSRSRIRGLRATETPVQKLKRQQQLQLQAHMGISPPMEAQRYGVDYDDNTTASEAALGAMLCIDLDKSCSSIVRQGLCRNSTAGLVENSVATLLCRKSCGMCGPMLALLMKDLQVPVEAAARARGCSDVFHSQCADRAGRGVCDTQTEQMMLECRASCGFCSLDPGTQSCHDALDLCPWLASPKHGPVDGLCGSGQHWWMRPLCRKSCQTCKSGQDNPLTNVTPGIMLGFDKKGHLVQAGYEPIASDRCSDALESCSVWAKIGECDSNPGFMHESCAFSCHACSVTKELYVAKPPATVMLNNGVMMPAIGFGTAGLGNQTSNAVMEALRAGYRHIDGAQAREWYREDLVGATLRKVLSSSSSSNLLSKSSAPMIHLRREDLFLTTKVHPKNLGYAETKQAVAKSLVDLGVEYLDLLLLHYRRCWKGLAGCPDQDEPAGSIHTWQHSWRAMEELLAAGTVRAIGVSNFNLLELRELLNMSKTVPQVLQVHLDPLRQDFELLTFCRSNGIQLEAYSSLGTQWPALQPGNRNPVLTHPDVMALAEAHRVTAAQLVLRWALQLGAVVLPRSSDPGRIRQNLDVWGFEVQVGEMYRMLRLKPQGGS